MPDQLVDIVVGKRYRVQCARLVYPDEKVRYTPIIGIEHSDPQFGVTRKHYHIDGRFTKIAVDSDGKTNNVVWSDKGMKDLPYKLEGIVNRYKVCVRLTTGIKPPLSATMYFDWYRGFVGESCKGRKCPHFGTIMLEKDGKLECPLHGLVGSIEEEKILPNEQEDAIGRQISEAFSKLKKQNPNYA